MGGGPVCVLPAGGPPEGAFVQGQGGAVCRRVRQLLRAQLGAQLHLRAQARVHVICVCVHVCACVCMCVIAYVSVHFGGACVHAAVHARERVGTSECVHACVR